MSDDIVTKRGKGRGRARGRGRGKGKGRGKGRGKTVVESEDEAFGQEILEEAQIHQPIDIQLSSQATENAEEKENEIAAIIDMEADISQLEAPTFTTLSRGPPEPMLRLKWDHKVSLIGEKVLNPMIHCCEQCDKPILIYGRMIPCKHVFCIKCAQLSEPLKLCPRCKDKIIRVEQSGLGTVFMCTYGGSRYGNNGCRRTYLSQRDLQAHINHRHITSVASVISACTNIAAPAPSVTTHSNSENKLNEGSKLFVQKQSTQQRKQIEPNVGSRSNRNIQQQSSLTLSSSSSTTMPSLSSSSSSALPAPISIGAGSNPGSASTTLQNHPSTSNVALPSNRTNLITIPTQENQQQQMNMSPNVSGHIHQQSASQSLQTSQSQQQQQLHQLSQPLPLMEQDLSISFFNAQHLYSTAASYTTAQQIAAVQGIIASTLSAQQMNSQQPQQQQHQQQHQQQQQQQHQQQQQSLTAVNLPGLMASAMHAISLQQRSSNAMQQQQHQSGSSFYPGYGPQFNQQMSHYQHPHQHNNQQQQRQYDQGQYINNMQQQQQQQQQHSSGQQQQGQPSMQPWNQQPYYR